MSTLYSVLLCLLVSLTYSTYADMDNKCMQCICKVESNCKDVGCKMDAGSLSCGYFQIKKGYYIDCGQPNKQPGESTDAAWRRCGNDYNCAKKCVNAYMKRYASRCKSYPTCETYARVHNGGPRGCQKSATLGYWNKVNACYR